jgi:hypothetical protein
VHHTPYNPSNAFEISWNGHSIVYHVNGTGNAFLGAAIRGATYTDNIIYAWGTVIAPPRTFYDTMTISSAANLWDAGGSITDFGVQQVRVRRLQQCQYEYEVTLNVVSPTGIPVSLAGRASITATALQAGTENSAPGLRVVQASTMMPGNIFKVWVYALCDTDAFLLPSGCGSSIGECDPIPLSFMFKVTGRPQ